MDIELLLLSGGEVFSPTIAVEGDIVTGVIFGGDVYQVQVVDFAATGSIVSVLEVDSLEFFDIFAATDRDINVDGFIDSFIDFPVLVTSRIVSPNLFDSLQMFDVIARVSFSPELFGGEFFYQGNLDAKYEILANFIESGSLFNPTVYPGDVGIVVNGFIDSLNIFPVRVRAVRVDPLRIKAAESNLGGDITRDYISPSQNYIQKDPLLNYDKRADFSYSLASTLMDRYTPSNEALFSKTFYRAFYIQNDSAFSRRRNIDFWIDGGYTYQIDGKRIYESEFLLAEEANRYGITLQDAASYFTSGASRTSMFGQLNVSYLVSSTRTLSRFGQDGRGIGIDLRNQVFTPGNQKTRLPSLDIGEYIGIYLKITTQFLPDFPIKSDYSFFHLSYTTDGNGFREKYPGQMKNQDGDILNILLPSLSMRVTTDYDRLEAYLKEDVRTLYNNYPPYFTTLEDIGEYE